MTRPLRLEFPGALYHVTARGNRQSPIFLDDHDRYAWTEILGKICVRCNFVVYAYCQMGNHHHLMIETAEGNLSQGMRQLNGGYTQNFNRRHGMVGHVLQGRYKSILVQKESYLLELARYVVLNPVRAGLVTSPTDWKWSSYRATVGDSDGNDWLSTDALLAYFGASRDMAIQSYREFVERGAGTASPLASVAHQLFLGHAAFVREHAERTVRGNSESVAKSQRRAAGLTLPEYEKRFPVRDEAMARAYQSTAFSMVDIGAHFGVKRSTVSRAIKKFDTEALRWS